MSIDKKTRAKRIWYGMLSRCFNKNVRGYHRYGGRGITVCERWRASFEDFYADMGPPAPDLSIERINNDGNYEPGNCKWATRHAQNKNKTHPKLPPLLLMSNKAQSEARRADLKRRKEENLPIKPGFRRT